MSKCKFCDKEFKSSNGCSLHTRLCELNPDRVDHPVTGTTSWRKGLTKDDPRIAESYAKRIATNNATGWRGFGTMNYNGTEAHKLSSARGGGYRENAGRSKKFRVLDSFGKEVVLQSTFELKCSEILNDLGISWIRPGMLKYDESRRYFADFYLPDHDLWLDPKNSYKAKLDEEKIEKVRQQNNVRLVVLLEDQLTKEFISGLVQR